MKDRAGDLANKVPNLRLLDHVRARPHLAEDQRAVGLGGDDLAADVESRNGAPQVVVVAEVVGKDQGLRAPGSVGKLDLATALRAANAEVETEAGPTVEPKR